jgi:hypothetical protein
MTPLEVAKFLDENTPSDIDTLHDLKPVYIKWLDSEQPNPDWEWLEDLDERAGIEIETLGWLVYHKKGAVGVALSKGRSSTRGKLMTHGLLRIPAIAIIHIVLAVMPGKEHA